MRLSAHVSLIDSGFSLFTKLQQMDGYAITSHNKNDTNDVVPFNVFVALLPLSVVFESFVDFGFVFGRYDFILLTRYFTSRSRAAIFIAASSSVKTGFSVSGVLACNACIVLFHSCNRHEHKDQDSYFFLFSQPTLQQHYGVS